MRLAGNHEARAAWARRHGLDPERIVDGDYMGRRTSDGLEYEFRQIIEGADGAPRVDTLGDLVTVERRVVVPTDDPLPPRWIV